MLELIVDEAQSLKEFTENNYAQGSFFWSQLLKNKDIKVNGKKIGENVFLAKGDIVAYYWPKKQEEKAAFYTVYEEENILIVDKESGVNSEAVFAALKRRGEYYFVHRLDRNTKGLLAFAKTPECNQELLTAFRERTATKRYHALCFGKIKQKEGLLTAYLKKDSIRSLVAVFDTPVSGSEKILTGYRVLNETVETCLLEVDLHTGKTHQIRAHLAHIGLPVVGDMKSGNTEKNRALSATRQCLVAKYLRFSFQGKFAYLNEKEFVSRVETKI